MIIDFSQTGNLAVLIIGFFAGLLMAKLFSSKGLGGCLTYLLALALLVIIINGLLQGYSFFIERITLSLEFYMYYNMAGIIGGGLGFLFGLLLFKRR